MKRYSQTSICQLPVDLTVDGLDPLGVNTLHWQPMVLHCYFINQEGQFYHSV